MRKKIIGSTIAVAALCAAAGVALASGSSPTGGGSRLDDGGALLQQAAITEQQAVNAAQRAAAGALDEVDLERYDGRLVFNVDVGDRDVKVDAATGEVLAAPRDDDPAGSDD